MTIIAPETDRPEAPPSIRPPFHEQTARFLEYHAMNPQVLAALTALIRTAWLAGVRKCSIATFYELTRWQMTQDAAVAAQRVGQEFDGRMFSMANSHKAYYARLLEHKYPILVGFFEKCASEADNRTDEWIAEASK